MTSTNNDDGGGQAEAASSTAAAAATFVLQNNFDSVSKPCFITLLKLLDNIVQKPGQSTVRRIKFSNAVIAQKIGGCKGGVDFLLSCGFTTETSDNNDAPSFHEGLSRVMGRGLGAVAANANSATAATSISSETTLVLLPERENTERLVAARHLLYQHCVKDLGCAPEDLPRLKPPPPPIVLLSDPQAPSTTSTAAAATARTNQNNNVVTFNPYQGQRYDALSASVGAKLGPPDSANYVSKTEAELGRLRQQQQQLQQQAESRLTTTNREWIVTLPGATAATAASSLNNPNAQTTAAAVPTSSDASLLAARAQTQQLERVQRETGGFTTAAMRDLERLKRQKVYSHVAVLVQCPDGTKLTGKFLPSERVSSVMESLQTDCFTAAAVVANDGPVEFDLYVTPPRRLLQPTLTLTEAGLVPAAKIFLSWKGWAAKEAATTSAASWIQPALLAPNNNNDETNTSAAAAASASAAHFPASVPVVSATSNTSMDIDNEKDDSDKKPAAKKLSKEERLLQRMMGGGSGSAGLGGGAAAGSKPSTGKPKLFK